MSRINFLIFLFLNLTWISVVHSNNCTSYADCRANEEYGEFSKCVNGTCYCLDFFTLSATGINCINVVPAGESCREHDQCRGTMGIHGICKAINATTRFCDCEALTDREIVLFNGKCTQVNKLGEPCTEDGQCIAGSNQFARCNHEVCGCLSNDIIEFTPDDHGMCIKEEKACVDLSVFAATSAGSVALLLLIVVIYRVTNPNRLSQKTVCQNSNQVPSAISNSILMHPGPSVKVEIPQ